MIDLYLCVPAIVIHYYLRLQHYLESVFLLHIVLVDCVIYFKHEKDVLFVYVGERETKQFTHLVGTPEKRQKRIEDKLGKTN